jgi:hypothetical protein
MNVGLLAVQAATSALFCGLWIFVGWRDFHHQKIRNRYLRYAAYGIATGYVVLLAMTVIGVSNWIAVFPTWTFYSRALSNIFMCGAAAAALWWFGVWPAGDAKLFILLAALYPLTNFLAESDYGRLFLVVLINTFIPASVAIFLRAGYYVFTTRLVHRRHFIVQLGWSKELHFLFDGAREEARRLGAAAASAVESMRLASDPWLFVARIGLWLVNMLVLSFFSAYLKNFFDSPVWFTFFWAAIFMLWGQLEKRVGSAFCRGLILTLGVGIFIFRPAAHAAELWRIFINLSLFNLFFRMGIRWSMTVLSGDMKTAYAFSFLMPLLGLLAAAAFGALASRLGGSTPAAMHMLFVLAGMGIFFGLSLVMVRLWDKEVLPSAIGEVSSYAVLAPAFIDRLRQDKEFFDANFSRLYADGLTDPQAQALQEWCAREGVEMIPLTPTISFAPWIFLGFFLARVLGGAHVLEYLF